MGLAGAVGITGALGLPPLARGLQGREADLVVFNAKVYTVDLRAPNAETFAVEAGRFAAVGTTEDMKAFIGKRTQRPSRSRSAPCRNC